MQRAIHRRGAYSSAKEAGILGAFCVYQFFKYSDALGVHLVGGPWRPDKCIAWLGADDVWATARHLPDLSHSTLVQALPPAAHAHRLLLLRTRRSL